MLIYPLQMVILTNLPSFEGKILPTAGKLPSVNLPSTDVKLPM